MKAAKAVDIETNDGRYQLGVTPDGMHEFIWGLSVGGYLTHMRYGGDYAVPADVLREQGERGFDRFYFDAGGNGRPIFVEMDELERAFRELELLDG